jgi:cytidylate kinase
MAIITVSGDVGCRTEAFARRIAQKLEFEFVNGSRLEQMRNEEIGPGVDIPDKAWRAAITSILARAAVHHHLVAATPGAESLFLDWPAVLRIYIAGRRAHRVGNLMLDRRLDRAAASEALREWERTEHRLRRQRFGRSTPAPDEFDLVMNAEGFDEEAAACVVERAAAARALLERGFLPAAAEAQIQFQTRLQLARHGITPAGKASLKRVAFNHPSEELFANLLDFYGIAWEYEPRSFPLQWDKNGKVIEAFTPDFYLPEFDLYVELTTMKQALVTRKNRKVKLLKAIYPHVNIQVFYQKDFQALVFKYGLSERVSAL